MVKDCLDKKKPVTLQLMNADLLHSEQFSPAVELTLIRELKGM